LGAYNGSVYGLDNTRERFSELYDVLRVRTDIRGLFLTGQDVATPGIVSNLFSG
jgi:phytoene dehydrogenase-like protein